MCSSDLTFTGSDRLRRCEVRVGAAYRHDPGAVIALLEATGQAVPGVLDNPAPKALMLSYGDSAINYALRFWIANPMQGVGISSAVNQAIWKAFQREGVEIPFPQQVLHVEAGEGAPHQSSQPASGSGCPKQNSEAENGSPGQVSGG